MISNNNQNIHHIQRTSLYKQCSITLVIAYTVYTESCTNTGNFCVSDCTGMDDGDYQACDTCRSYVSCSGGLRLPLKRACPHWRSTEESNDEDDEESKIMSLLWDDDYQRCDWTSTTCTCRGKFSLRCRHIAAVIWFQYPIILFLIASKHTYLFFEMIHTYFLFV